MLQALRGASQVDKPVNHHWKTWVWKKNNPWGLSIYLSDRGEKTETRPEQKTREEKSHKSSGSSVWVFGVRERRVWVMAKGKAQNICLLFIGTRPEVDFGSVPMKWRKLWNNPRDLKRTLWSHRRWVIYAVVSCRRTCIHGGFMAGMRSTEFCTAMLTC